MRFLLAPHGGGALRALVPQPRLLHDAPAILDGIDLAADLVFERLLKIPEGVEVLDLDLRAECRLAGRAHRHVRVAAQAALFHVAVVHLQPDQEVAEGLEEQGRFAGRAKIGLGHDLDERHAGTVVVEVRMLGAVGEPFVKRLAGILLEMDAGDPDGRALSPAANLDLPSLASGWSYCEIWYPFGRSG